MCQEYLAWGVHMQFAVDTYVAVSRIGFPNMFEWLTCYKENQ